MAHALLIPSPGCRGLLAWCGLLAAPLLFLAPSPACGPVPAKKKLHCPVIGLPECKNCKCPSGYCPLMPREQEALSFKGAKLLFCCGQCKKIFEKSPEKFSANAHHQLVASAQARQEKCPLCGGTTSPECVCELGGVKVQLCSKGCQEKLARAKPAEQVEMLFGEKAFQRGFILVKK